MAVNWVRDSGGLSGSGLNHDLDVADACYYNLFEARSLKEVSMHFLKKISIYFLKEVSIHFTNFNTELLHSEIGKEYYLVQTPPIKCYFFTPHIINYQVKASLPEFLLIEIFP